MSQFIFYSTEGDVFTETQTSYPLVHIRIQKRTNKKFITFLEGVSKEQGTMILKDARKLFNTNGGMNENEEGEVVLTIQGDKRNDLKKYLLQKKITLEENIKIHGF